MMRKTLFETGVGFGTMLFSSALVAVTAALLSLAFIGFLLRLPFRPLYRERSPWSRHAHVGREVCRQVVGIADEAATAAASMTSAARVLGLFLLETCSGAGVGVLLALLAAGDADPSTISLLIGGALGAALGGLAALAHLRARGIRLWTRGESRS